MTERIFFAILVFIPLLVFVNWRKTIILCTIWIILEGAFRKWFMPGLERQLYLLKDIIMIIAYAKFFNSRKMRIIKDIPVQQAVKALVIALFIWSVLGTMNQEFSNVLVNLFGLKQFFVFVPLLIVIPHLFKDKESIFSFAKLYLFAFIPVGILGVIQFLSSPGSIINQYVGSVNVATAAGHARITGSFSYISGYGAYLTFLVALGVGYLGRKLKPRETMVVLSILFFAVLNILMTASRGPFFSAVIVIASYMLIFFWKAKKTIQKIIVGVIIAGLVFVYFAPIYLESMQVLSSRGTRDIASRIKQPFLEVVRAAEDISLFGHGIGATQKGTLSLLAWKFRKRHTHFESEPNRIMFEVGIIGFILYYLIKMFVILIGWKVYSKLKDLELKSIALPFVFLLLLQFSHQTAFDPISNFYFWFMTGTLCALRNLDAIGRGNFPPGNQIKR